MRSGYNLSYDPEAFVTDPGDQFHVIYSPCIEKDGSMSLKPSGKENIQDFIESQRGSTDMAYILKQLELGDMSVISKGTPSYGDFVNMPKTYAEVLQMQIDAGKTFQQLPLDVRNKFDNDINKFLAAAGSEEWYEKLGAVKKSAEQQSEEQKESVVVES